MSEGFPRSTGVFNTRTGFITPISLPPPPPEEEGVYIPPPPPEDYSTNEKVVEKRILVRVPVTEQFSLTDRRSDLERGGMHNGKISSMGATDPLYSTTGLFKSVITDNDLWQMYTRYWLVNKVVNKVTGSCINKWFKFKAVKTTRSTERFFDIINKLFRDIQFAKYLKMALRMGFVYGVGWIALSYQDGAPITATPARVKELQYLSTVANNCIKPVAIDNNPLSRTYGAPLIYEIRFDNSLGVTSNSIRVHATRIIRVVPLPIDDSYKGMSLIYPIYDTCLIGKRMEFDIGDMWFRMSKPLPEFTTPDNKDDYDRCVSDFGEDGIQSSKVWIHKNNIDPLTGNPQWKLDLHGFTDKVLPPTDFYEPIIKSTLAGTPAPQSLVMGAIGSSQGNESNVENYYSEISDIQNTILSPLVREFITNLDENGGLKALGWNKAVPEFEIVWNPIFELTAKELSQKSLMDARTNDLYHKMGAKTVEEVRALDLGLPPLEPEQKTVDDFPDDTEGKGTSEPSVKAPFDTHPNSIVYGDD